MKAFYKDLFDYNYHMNQNVIAVFIKHSTQASEKAIKLMSHILNAHQIWINRIDKLEEPYGVMQIHSLNTFERIDLSNYTNTMALLEGCDLEKIISYTNTSGKTYKNSIKDVLFHIVNHSNYHRAQIASSFKDDGIPPVVTDYIFYKR